MCLGKLYVEDGNEPLLENVTRISQENGQLKFTTLFGEEESFTGEIKQIDFSDSKIFITKK